MANILENSMDYLAQFDPEIASQMQSEYQRQQRNIELIASENIASPAVIAAIKEAGGSVHHGPSEVPGPAWIAIAQDPQGAWFALVGPEK